MKFFGIVLNVHEDFTNIHAYLQMTYEKSLVIETYKDIFFISKLELWSNI